VFNVGSGFEEIYSVNKAPWPMTNRDFVERRYKQFSGPNELIVYFYSVENEDRPPVATAERAHTLFGAHILRQLSPGIIKVTVMV
jgi:hypothetical protein